jgi:hypothetical protein
VSRRRTSYPIRCWQMAGVAATLAAAGGVVTLAAHLLGWLVSGRWS